MTPQEQAIIDHLSRGREPLTREEINLALMQAYAFGDLDQEPEIKAGLGPLGRGFDPNQARDPTGKWVEGGGGNKPSIKSDLSKTGDAKQPVSSIDDLYAKARADEPAFTAAVQQIAAVTGGDIKLSPAGPDGSRLKTRARVEQKVRDEYKGDVSQIKDVLRATVVHNSVRDSRIAAAAFIAQHGKDIIRVKDRFATQSSGYRDILVNLRTPSGVISEIQFNSRQLMLAKAMAGHQLYERVRTAPKTNIGSMANGVFIPKMKALYDDAYQKDGNGHWTTKKKKP